MKPIPLPAENNPGQGSSLTIAFTNGTDNWDEVLELTDMLSEVLTEGGYHNEVADGWVILESDLALLPQFLQFDLDEEGTAQTSTTIEIRSLSGLFAGVFEYQHARSDESVGISMRTGFKRWMQVDLIVLLDALQQSPEHCATMRMRFNDEEEVQPRRIVLGPVEHYAAIEASEEEEHPFCSCCLFSNSGKGFLPFLKADGFYAVRMYAARNGNGELMADCRVNGEDWEEGRLALLEYVGQWPQRGLEYRKQMIVIQRDITDNDG